MKTIYYRRTFLVRDQLNPDAVAAEFLNVEEIQYITGLGHRIRVELLPIHSFTSQTWQVTFHVSDNLYTVLQLKYLDSEYRHDKPVRGLDICEPAS